MEKKLHTNSASFFQKKYSFTSLQMFAGIYRDFAGKLECRDFKFKGIACITAIPVIVEINQKKVWSFYRYILFIKIFQISL